MVLLLKLPLPISLIVGLGVIFVVMCPTEGLLVLFPSWLSHSVTRLGDASAGERIAVAFNVHGAEV